MVFKEVREIFAIGNESGREGREVSLKFLLIDEMRLEDSTSEINSSTYTKCSK